MPLEKIRCTVSAAFTSTGERHGGRVGQEHPLRYPGCRDRNSGCSVFAGCSDISTFLSGQDSRIDFPVREVFPHV